MKTIKITRSITNIPLLELHNYCINNDIELDLANEEIILFEAQIKEKGLLRASCESDKRLE